MPPHRHVHERRVDVRRKECHQHGNGRNAGEFHWVHNMAVDSKGNIYTTEVDNAKRAQKFVYRGTAPVPAE